MPIFYGLIKIHKDCKIRPITSTVDSPGYALSRILCDLINGIFEVEPYHIRDALEFKEKMDNIVLDDDDILISMDVISMFTTIPTELVIEIVMGRREIFVEKFNVEPAVLHGILDFVLNKCNYFVFDGKIFRQRSGLPMGGCVSPLMARLVMDQVVTYMTSNMSTLPKFIGIFVDDSIFVLNKNTDHGTLKVLNSYRPNTIRFTMERENENLSINFLNLSLTRNNGKIITNWFSKPYASKRLLNYFSSHKRSTIIATGENFIKTVLFMSDSSFYEENKHIIINRLRVNNFPEDLIAWLMNQHYTLLRPRNKNRITFFNFYNPTLPRRINITKNDKNMLVFLTALQIEERSRRS